MDKLKQIFSPGSSKEDEVKYGTPGSSEASTAPQLQTDPDAQNKSHGIGRQILNPQGEKYSEQSYGRTASVGNGGQPPPPAGTLQSQHEIEQNNQGGVLRQILNPNGEKYSELGHGTTTATGSAAQPALPGSNPSNSAALPITSTLETDTEAEKKNQGGVLRQILNPHGDKYSEQSYGTTTTQTPGRQTSTGMNQSLLAPAADDASALGVKSDVKEPYAQGADTLLIGADNFTSAGPSTSRTPAQTSTQAPQDSREWRDSTLAGIGAATTTGGVASSGGLQRENRADDVSQSTYTARSYALPSGAAGEPQGPDRTVLPTDTSNAPPPGSSDYIQDDSLAGAGTIVGAGGVGASELAAQENKLGDPEVANATYTDRAYPVGGSTRGGAAPDASSRQILPHVPGEFPTESGYDPHMPGAFPETPAGGSTTSGGTYLDYGGMMSGGQPTTTTGSSITPGGESSPIMTTTNSVPRASFSEPAPVSAQEDSHTGRDAAIIGGVGAGSAAAGYGIYNATRGDDTRDQVVQDRSVPATTSAGPSATHTTYSGPSQSSRGEPADESHLGRNTAIAGGTAATGAAGYGAYEATRGDSVRDQAQQNSGPSQTTTSRSTVAEPSRTEHTGTVTGNEHTGPLNSHKHDPALQQSTNTSSTGPTNLQSSQPASSAPQDESNFGRNAAIAGGATGVGAAGYGLYEANRGQDVTGQATQDRSAPSTTGNTISDLGSSGGPLNSHKHSPDHQQSTTTSSTTSTQPTALASTQQASREPEESHTGRSAALAGGAAAGTGAAGYGLYEATNRDEQPPSGLLNSHKHDSNYQQSSSTITQPTTSGYTQPTTTASTQPRPQPEESHPGRNAAYAGGATAATGAAGYGVYEATRRDDLDQAMQDRGALQQQQQQQPSTMDKLKEKFQSDKPKEETTKTEKHKEENPKHEKHHEEKPKHEKTTTQTLTKDEVARSDPARTQQPEETHYGRDAALVGGTGAAAGAVGYGAYEAGKDRETIPTDSRGDSIREQALQNPNAVQTTPGQAYGTTNPNELHNLGSSQPTRTAPEESHTGRNAAYAGGATAATGAAGYGAYEAGKDHETDPSRSSAESSSNKVSTDDKGHHHLHKKAVEQQGEKKPTLLQKILHPNKTKHEQEEREAARRSFDQPGHSGSNPEIELVRDSHGAVVGTQGYVNDPDPAEHNHNRQETELVRDSHGAVVGTQGYLNDPDPVHHGQAHQDTELVRGSDGAVAGTQGYVDERGSQPTAAAPHHDGMM